VIPLRDANPTRRPPVVTIGLVVTCVLVFVYELWTQSTGGDAALDKLFDTWGLVPATFSQEVKAGGAGALLGDGSVPVLTSMFLHGGWIHLIGNMLYLWIFGNNIEDRFGRIGFLLFYLFGGVMAAVTQVWIDPTSTVPIIGASGAIAAVLGAYLVLYPRARVLSLVYLGFFYQLLQVPALIVLGMWFVLQLIDGLASLGVPASNSGVALFEHIGGFVTGVGIAAILRALGAVRSTRPPGPLDEFRVG
jgi:membrane associated rhomboid family serine protease